MKPGPAASPGGERESPLVRDSLNASPAAPRALNASPGPKVKASEPAVACTPPRTPAKKGPAAKAAAKGAASPAAPKAKAKGKAKQAAAASEDARAMMPPPSAAAKQKRRKKEPAPIGAKGGAKDLEFKTTQLQRPQLPPKLPEDNYEISDREGSDGEIAEEAGGKRVPAWVEGFQDKAVAQADVDPGSVFGRGVPICDIDEIFPDALYRSLDISKVKRVRGSSCRWRPDRLKGTEIKKYAEKMGQRRRLSFFNRKSLMQGVAAAKSRGAA